MATAGTTTSPLRVAVVGSGPAAFYTVQSLREARQRTLSIDMFDRLPTPFGLVRHGVAPDHPKIKSVCAVYHKLALHPDFRFFGNVEIGRDLVLDDLREHYHQIVFCTGAQTDRTLGIPGEELAGSHSATEFVAWYNGHPDYTSLRFDLDCERAVVIGVGNVAVDVARILCRPPEELAETDIADYALAALERSRVREVWLVGRRGPAQAAFTNPEIRELGAITGTDTLTRPEEVGPEATGPLPEPADKATLRKLEILRGYAARPPAVRPRRLVIRFLVSPTAILGDERGRVRAVRLCRNELRADSEGRLEARPTAATELVEAGLVFRSVGYRGVALAGLPFDERRGLVPNAAGRVIDPATGGEPVRGVYVSGWIKRGPTGVIGTNKPDAAETAASMAEDLAQGRTLDPRQAEPEAIERLLAAREVRFVSYEDWCAADAREIERGRPVGRPRVKFTDVESFLRGRKAR
jgi:ferredoxin--NADP+ reductase